MLGLGRLGDPTHTPEPAPRTLARWTTCHNLESAFETLADARSSTTGRADAKGLEHPTCAANGCERPYTWCELHHRQPWSRGGRTDLADAIPLCSQHHHWIHDAGYNPQTLSDGTIRFRRRR